MSSLPIAAGGIAVATYQSCLQAPPPGTVSCSAGQPGLIEQLVEWLGDRLPQLFMATGFCEDAELWVMGLSLANWALVSFGASLAVAAWALLSRRQKTEIFTANVRLFESASSTWHKASIHPSFSS